MGKEEEVEKPLISPIGNGFALLEVLMAVVILGLASTVLVAAISQSDSFLAKNRTRSLAIAQAPTILAQYQLGLGEKEGTVAHTPWHWQISQQETELGLELTLAFFDEKGLARYRFKTVGREL